MKIETPSGIVVDTDKRLWGQNLSDDDFDYCEWRLSQEHYCPRDCRCSVCIQEDSDMIDAWEIRQRFREST